MTEPRFKIEALGFRALNETGVDRFGPDEGYVTIHVPALDVATRTQVFEDVNAGETRSIPLDQSWIPSNREREWAKLASRQPG